MNQFSTKILVADDSRSCREIMKARLEQWGYEVILAHDGEAALNIFQAPYPPDFLILDWEMPKLTGIDVCQVIRKLQTKVHPYIIMVTSNVDTTHAVQALESGADDFVPKNADENELQARVAVGIRTLHLQQKLAQAVSLQSKSIKKQQKLSTDLQKTLMEVEGLVSALPVVLIGLTPTLHIYRWNAIAECTFQLPASSMEGTQLEKAEIDWSWEEISKGIDTCMSHKSSVILQEIPYTNPEGSHRILQVSINPISHITEEKPKLLLLAEDITARKTLQNQLNLAQKMESIGHLAAGVAHEINTPIQYIGDNLRFLTESMPEIFKILEGYTKGKTAESGKIDVDLDFLTQEIPMAMEQSLSGADQVAKIVAAMKDFSHPGTESKMPVNINSTIDSALTVAKNQWKTVAKVVTNFEDSIPPVPCLPGQFHQIILNLIINASHAIADRIKEDDSHAGVITVTSQTAGNYVDIRVQDNGIGIPEEIREKIFNPFFMTKQVGKGTGQGLDIVHDVVVTNHHGKLGLETEVGKGSTFIISFPIHDTADLDSQEDSQTQLATA